MIKARVDSDENTDKDKEVKKAMRLSRRCRCVDGCWEKVTDALSTSENGAKTAIAVQRGSVVRTQSR